MNDYEIATYGALPTLRDINVRLLLEASDEQLAALCRVNTAAAEICRDDDIWRQRSERYLPKFLRFKKYYSTWRQLYQEVRKDCYYMVKFNDYRIYTTIEEIIKELVELKERYNNPLRIAVIPAPGQPQTIDPGDAYYQKTILLCHNSELLDLNNYTEAIIRYVDARYENLNDLRNELRSYPRLLSNGITVSAVIGIPGTKIIRLYNLAGRTTLHNINDENDANKLNAYYFYVAPLTNESLNYLYNMPIDALMYIRVQNALKLGVIFTLTRNRQGFGVDSGSPNGHLFKQGNVFTFEAASFRTGTEVDKSLQGFINYVTLTTAPLAYLRD